MKYFERHYPFPERMVACVYDVKARVAVACVA